MKKLMMGAAAALSLGGVAVAQDYIGQIEDQLIAAVYSAFSEGYVMDREPVIDAMYEGETDIFELYLEEGYEYAIVAVCDTDCSDIDLTLYDGAGNEIDVDELSDDVPIVEVEPIFGETFEFEVTVYDCSNEPCYYGVGVFAR